jgi:Cu(I)/Ag(I) efflux system membrane fusion protein
LEEGDRVVIQGAFKIDSSLQIQAKPSMMNPEGGGPTPGHNHGSQEAHTHSQAEQVGLTISQDIGPRLIGSYLKLQSALASDNLEEVKSEAKEMMDITGHSGALTDLIHTMLAADSLDAIRRPHFDRLSAAMIDAVKADSHAYEGDLLLMHCPMVYPDRGADWLQASEPLQNPYFGAAMLNCGNLKENLTSHEGHEH